MIAFEKLISQMFVYDSLKDVDIALYLFIEEI